MTVQLAETILLETGIGVALRHRFAYDTGTLLRLENYAIINIFDDGRYYIQGANTEALVGAFSLIEEPWDPDTWSGEVPNPSSQTGIRPPSSPDKRYDW